MGDVLDMLIGSLPKLNVSQLEALFEQLELQVPDTKRGNKKLLVGALRRYFLSEDVEDLEDEGVSIFDFAQDQINGMLSDPQASVTPVTTVVATPVVKEEGDGVGVAGNVGTRIEVQKIREFKISGSIGMVGAKETMSYTSLSFQIQQGKSLGYSMREISHAVIKAIKPGIPLKNYLESRLNITENGLIQMLRSHYREKDSTSVFNEMANSAQLATENELDFCLRMMSLRERVISLSMEEDTCPFSSELVRHRFFHTLSTGFRSSSVRLELRDVLKGMMVSDEDLVKEISMVMSKETEHANKIKKTRVDVAEVDVEQNVVLKEIAKLSAKFNELSTMKKEITDLKNEVATLKRSNTASPATAAHKFKCNDCAARSVFCTHCLHCGLGGHKHRECPSFNSNTSLNK